MRFEFVYSPGFDAPIAGTAAPEPSTWAMIDRVRGAWLCRLAGAAKERGARGLVPRGNEKGGPKAAIFQRSQAKTAAEPPKSAHRWPLTADARCSARLPKSIRKARNALPLAPNGIGGHTGLKLRHCEAVLDRVDIGAVSGIALIAAPIGDHYWPLRCSFV